MSRGGIATTFLAVVTVTYAAGSVAPPSARGSQAWKWPVAGEVVTGYRNGGDPYAGGQHRGIDVAAPVGTPVAAATGGTVRFAGLAGSSGLTVSIRSSDGRFDTSYLHLSRAVVREGDRVEGGEHIAAVGMSGRRSALTPHLHFGVRDAGSRHAYRDPLDFLPPVGRRPVREVPRGAPVLVRAPLRVRPAPAPVRTPSPARRAAPVRRRVRVPAGRRIRVPQGVRVPQGAPATVALPHLVPARAPSGLAAPASHGIARGGLPAPSMGPGPLPAARPQRAVAPSRPRTAPAADRGPDLGWALACSALLLAAVCLGRPGYGRAEEERSRGAVWSRRLPLLGRR